MDGLAPLLLTDEGPNLSAQPNKLWVSAHEFQHAREQELGTTLGDITVDDARTSLRAVAYPPMPVSQQGSPSSVSIIDEPPVVSSKKQLFRSFKRVNTFPPPPPPPLGLGVWPLSYDKRPSHLIKQATALINNIDQRTSNLLAFLLGLRDIDVRSQDEVASRHAVLEEAVKEALLLRDSVKHGQYPQSAGSATTIERRLRQIHDIISLLGSSLPPKPPQPQHIDAGKLFKLLSSPRIN